jgi:hypothetical protein
MVPLPRRLVGIFLGHTYIVTATGQEIVDQWPFELVAV